MAQRDDIHELARGRWRGILMAAGFNEKHLTGKHGPCPFCEGTDRWRWTNHDNSGAAICNVCGPKTGVDLVMMRKGIEFLDAKKWIMGEIGRAPIEKAPKRNNEASARKLSKLWMEARPLDAVNEGDPASRYLRKRGIVLSTYPSQLRWHPSVGYLHDDRSVTHHPALISKFVAPDAKAWTLHLTFLDAQGNKAALPKPKKLAPLSVPNGGAVRLAASAETMGVSTGIETALSASLLHDVPVWATLSDGLLVKWEPPPTAKHILIFGDPDANFSGHAASYALAHRLACKNYHVEVRMPPDIDVDWNDALVANMEFA